MERLFDIQTLEKIYFYLVPFIALQGIVIGTFLIFRDSYTRPSRHLGLFLLAYTVSYINSILFSTGKIFEFPVLLFLPLNFQFVFAPLLYLYAKRLVRPLGRLEFRKRMLPGAIEFLVFLLLFCFPVANKIWLVQQIEYHYAYYVYLFLGRAVFTFYYVYKTWRLISRHQQRVSNYYSNSEGKNLAWLKNGSAAFLIYTIAWSVPFWILIATDNSGQQIFLDILITIFDMLFITWIGFMGYQQATIMNAEEMLRVEHSLSNAIRASHQELTAKSALEEEAAVPEKPSQNAELFEQINLYLVESEAYAKQELNLSSLAESLMVPPRKLSQTIKENSDLNFNQFINRHRVHKVKQLIENPEFEHYDLISIARSAGFKSKATFNAAFKQFEAKTPKTYREEILKTAK